MVFRVYGVKVSLDWDGLTLDEMKPLGVLDWEQMAGDDADVCFRVRERVPGRFSIEKSGAPVGTANSRPACLDFLQGALPLAVAEFSREMVLVHAGAVAFGKCGLILPGHSGSGKSRLTRSLSQRGATLYSDEFAVISPDGLLHSFPRWTKNRRGQSDSTDQEMYPPPSSPVPISLVLFLRFEAQQTRLALSHLTSGQACMKVLEHTPCARTRPQCLPILAQICQKAKCFAGLRGEAVDSCLDISALLSKAFPKEVAI